MFSTMKKILVKNTAKLKTIIVMMAFGASALAVNISRADNGDGLGVKDYRLPSALSQTIRLNRDGRLETISDISESTAASELSELMAVSAGHELMGISDAPGDVTTSELREFRRVFDNHGRKTIFEKPERAAISVVPEPTTIFAGALLLLPLGVSIVRNLRSNKKCGHQND